MRHYTIILLSILTSFSVFGQEFDFKVSVKAPSIANADPTIFKKLETEVSNMINNNRWTEDEYQAHEKINGQLNITITKELSATSFEAEIAIISGRPVYKSTSSTQTMKYLDKNVQFSYDGVQPVQKTDNTYIDNLSSIITFYMYYVLGLDYDSFSLSGGTPYFQKAFDVYNSIPSNIQRGDKGWTNEDNSRRNRYFLIQNTRNPSLREFRRAFYEYHRLGLDEMHRDAGRARAVMTSAITQMGEADNNNPGSVLIRMFTDAKEMEILDVYKVAIEGEKKKVGDILGRINPLKASIFKNM